LKYRSGGQSDKGMMPLAKPTRAKGFSHLCHRHTYTRQSGEMMMIVFLSFRQHLRNKWQLFVTSSARQA
jgi:hypothetical protein